MHQKFAGSIHRQGTYILWVQFSIGAYTGDNQSMSLSHIGVFLSHLSVSLKSLNISSSKDNKNFFKSLIIYFIKHFKKDFIYSFLDRGGGRAKERERNIDV